MTARAREFRRCCLEAYIDFPGLPRRFDWHVVNVSPTGCQVSGNIKLKLGDGIACVLTVPGSALDIHITARVVWRSENTYGLEFQEFPAGARLRLAMALYKGKKAA